MKHYLQQLTFKKVFWLVFGVVLIAFSISLLRLSNCGTDPYTGMNLGISKKLGVSLGNYQLCMNLILLIFVIFWSRHALGLGTLVNMVGLGYICDFFMKIWSFFHLTPDVFLNNWPARIFLVIVALIVLCIGAAFYMEVDLGVAPYDALAPMIDQKTHGAVPFAIARVATDIFCVVVSFAVGSVVGIATIITAFGTGPFISFFRRNLARKVLEG